jgi:hypothetical protein
MRVSQRLISRINRNGPLSLKTWPLVGQCSAASTRQKSAGSDPVINISTFWNILVLIYSL